MAKKRCKPDEIVGKPRQAEVLHDQNLVLGHESLLPYFIRTARSAGKALSD